VIVKKYH